LAKLFGIAAKPELKAGKRIQQGMLCSLGRRRMVKGLAPARRGPDWMLTSVSYIDPLPEIPTMWPPKIRRLVNRHTHPASPLCRRRWSLSRAQPLPSSGKKVWRSRCSPPTGVWVAPERCSVGCREIPCFFRHFLKPHLKKTLPAFESIDLLQLLLRVMDRRRPMPGWDGRVRSLLTVMKSRIDVGPMNHGVAADAGRTGLPILRSCYASYWLRLGYGTGCTV